MDLNAITEAGGWTKTRAAVTEFRRLLLCSRCSKLMNEPVCLGVCEHMLCRSCAGPQAGAGCVICHSPAWVKDIQINRQLSNITDLFRSLESLLNLTENSEQTPVEIQTQSENSVFKHKKNFKIWFSPRSRKVRCRAEKPAEVAESVSDGKTEKTPTSTPSKITPTEFRNLSIFNFNSSSQDSGPSSPERGRDIGNKKKKLPSGARKPAGRGGRPATRKQTKQAVKKMKLEAINKQWGIGGEGETEGEKTSSGQGDRMSARRVSFFSPAMFSDESPQDNPQENSELLSPSKSIPLGGQTGEGAPISNDQDQSSGSQLTVSVPLIDLGISPQSRQRTAEQELRSPPEIHVERTRMEERDGASQSTPKRPRASPNQGRHTVPGQRRITRKARKDPRDSPCSPASMGKQSPGTPGGSRGRLSQSSPAVMKRNYKGETPLHLAAIKGNVEAVRELLDRGADPNLKDNAGWTPLHEACNLGHRAAVEVLVEGGALLNTPGYDNDSPLHDAVRNGHLDVARLLLERGASRTVLNMFGLRPVDCATSPEMQAVFQAAPEGPRPAITPISPPPSLGKVSDNVKRDERVVVLGSKLSQRQQNRLTKLGQVLGGSRAESFSSSVTHVVVPDGAVPSTLTALRAVLRGCWVLRFSWAEACLQAGSWTAETGFEAGEGPQRSRVNRWSLLPPLFDGCFFFFLGPFKSPPRAELLQLVREGGGQVLSRQPKPDSDVTQTLSAAAYHAPPGSDQALCTQYIIYDPQGSHKPPRVRLGKVWSAPSSWVISCISAFQIQPVPEALTC